MLRVIAVCGLIAAAFGIGYALRQVLQASEMPSHEPATVTKLRGATALLSVDATSGSVPSYPRSNKPKASSQPSESGPVSVSTQTPAVPSGTDVTTPPDSSISNDTPKGDAKNQDSTNNPVIGLQQTTGK